MYPHLIISGIVFALLIIFLIVRIRTSVSGKEYGEELKRKSGVPSELENTETNPNTYKVSVGVKQKEEQKKRTKIIVVAAVLLILVSGTVIRMINGKNGDNNTSDFFPFWLIILIPLLAAKKKKKPEITISKSKKQ